MRKNYKKPELLVERFALTQLLSNCVVLIGHSDSMCVMNDQDATDNMKDMAANGVFITNCDEYITGKDFEDGLCYHTSVNLAFSS